MPDSLLVIARGVQIAASLLLAGIFTFEVVVLGPVSWAEGDDRYQFERRLLRLAFWSLLAALLSALLWFLFEVTNMTGLPLGRAFSGRAWQTVLFQTGFGRVWQLRLGLIAAAFALVSLGLVRETLRSALKFALWLLAIALLVSLAFISHAAAARAQPPALLGDALHLAAAGGWIGGLLPLTILLADAQASASLGAGAARALRRFSMLSLCSVSVLILSGLSNSWILVGSFAALFTTRYGALLLCKLLLFVTLLGFGARNRFIVKTELARLPARPDLYSLVRRNVISELCLGVAVVAIVGWLGATPPARAPVERSGDHYGDLRLN